MVDYNRDIRAALDKHMPNNWTIQESGGGSIEIMGVLKATGVRVNLYGSRTAVLETMEALLRVMVDTKRLPDDPGL